MTYDAKTIIIAEIGTSHEGSIQKAKALIDAASDAGADMIKFQWVYADEILHPLTGIVSLPTGNITLYERFKNLEVSPLFFKECLEYTHKKGLFFCCTPFGLKSLEELVAIEPDAIKIASPELNHTPLLNACAQYYNKIPIIISSGVSKLSDIEHAVHILRTSQPNTIKNSLSPLTLLHCITSYPAPENEYNVRTVKTLHDIFGIDTGISDHSLSPVMVPTLTVAMGGTMIEKHITLSKKTSGLDDPVALEPQEFAQMVQAVHQANAVMLHAYKSEIAEGAVQEGIRGPFEVIKRMEEQFGAEKIQAVLGTGIKNLAPSEFLNYGRTNRSLHYLKDLKKGDIVSLSDIAVLRTEKVLSPGISPDFLDTINGAMLQSDVKGGDGVLLEHFIRHL